MSQWALETDFLISVLTEGKIHKWGVVEECKWREVSIQKQKRSKKRDTVWSVTERLQISQESAESRNWWHGVNKTGERIPTLNTGWTGSGKLNRKRQGRILSALVILQNCSSSLTSGVIYFHSQLSGPWLSSSHKDTLTGGSLWKTHPVAPNYSMLIGFCSGNFQDSFKYSITIINFSKFFLIFLKSTIICWHFVFFTSDYLWRYSKLIKANSGQTDMDYNLCSFTSELSVLEHVT